MSQFASAAGRFAVRAAQSVAPAVGRAAATAAAQAATVAAQNALFGPIKRRGEGPRRQGFYIQTAAEGEPVPRVYGRARLGTQVLWMTPFREETVTDRTRTGGKGVQRSVETETTTYRYRVSLALGLCEGEIARISRVWADGQPFALHETTHRIYRGTEDQLPDALIEAAEGPDRTPGFRGLAYLVIEDLDITPFGARLPQFSVEVERTLAPRDETVLEALARSVTLIPGSGEAVYNTTPVIAEAGEGVSQRQNSFNTVAPTDLLASLDHLEGTLKGVEAVSLIVSWFGSDLRAGDCRIEPKVEVREKTLQPDPWSVAGTTRDEAAVVSELDGSPAYGGTPSDTGVREAIRELKDRGLAVTFYPFILMDVPPGAALPAPEGGLQGAYPWRGRISVPAAIDGTAAARDQIDALMASYAPMIRHYAQLCADEGGVEAFLLGSELRGLTRVRDETGAFPFVEALIDLAAEVRGILGPSVKLSYAADWSEYSNYRPQDGSNDVLFPLDPLWADENIDFIGIDNYLPLTDWREGTGHLDAAAGYSSIYDRAYLEAGIRGGEGYEWFYASAADRIAQIRTPIIDTAAGEDWIFRPKDLWSWWSTPHHERPGGVRAQASTVFVPRSKPIWFTELGCPATDKGSNQPNVFYDPKSSESFFPYFSDGSRDDVIQRRFLEAHLRFWAEPENNPVSDVYGGSMVDPARIALYTWDARPFPDFPVRGTLWADTPNWVNGHWLTGRVGLVPVGAIIEDLAAETGVVTVDAEACTALVAGFVIDRPMGVRNAIEPLLDLYAIDVNERAYEVLFRPRTGETVRSLDLGELVLADGPVLSRDRMQAEDRPSLLTLSYTDGLSDYRPGVAHAGDPASRPEQQIALDTPVILEAGEAEARAMASLAQARVQGEVLSFGLSRTHLDLEPGDTVHLDGGAFRITAITDGPWREMRAVSTDAGVFRASYTGLAGSADPLPPVRGPVAAAILDLPLPAGSDAEAVLRAAGFASPWPGGISLFQGGGSGARFVTSLGEPSLMGRLTAPLGPGAPWRWNRGPGVSLVLSAGTLVSRDREAVLAGEGWAAVRSTLGTWELLAYQTAEMDEYGVWRLSHLLRGLRGTEAEAAAGAEAEAQIVFLEGSLAQAPLSPDLIGTTGVFQAGPPGARPGRYPARQVEEPLIGASLRPLAPVHLKAEPEGEGLRLSWIRRSRTGGDNWALPDIPLGEAAERYRVEGFGPDGDRVLVETVETPLILLPAGLARVTVAQISSQMGPGRAASLVL